MAKIQIKSEKIATYGGIFHFMDVFEGLNLEKLIDSTLKTRTNVPNAYPYSTIFKSLFVGYLCGASCLEDINELAPQFNLRPGTHTPNADTIGRALKELASEPTVYTCEDSHKSYKFDEAAVMNELLLKMTKSLKIYHKNQPVTLDFDHQFIPTHKRDAQYSYKGDFGYFPGLATIGGVFVGGENRDGNTSVKFHQADTLQRIMDRVKDVLEVKIENFRADCGSYTKDVISTVESRCTHFYIRASNCADRREEFDKHQDWQDVEINAQKCQLASFTIKVNEKDYRLVVQRTRKTEDGKPEVDLFGDVYVYRAIITNDWKTSEKGIVLFYNKRGESEKNFDIQNNDFGWKHLPFSDLAQNTVFMLATAMLKNFYLYVVKKLSLVVPGIKETSRLKSVIFHFIAVPAKWVYTSRQHILKLFTTWTYYATAFGT